MRQNDFYFRLLAATLSALKCAARFVENEIVINVEYTVLLNQSFDGNRTDTQSVYPDEDNVVHHGLDCRRVVECLWRDRKVPQWIDVAVAGADEKTLLSLHCCGRFETDERQLYYFDRGTQPFGIKSPPFPPNHVDGVLFRLPSCEQARLRLERR